MNYKNAVYILIITVALSNIAIAEPQHKPRIAEGASASTNWAGYAVTPQNLVNDVKGSWVVPAVNCRVTKNAYSSFWVGIDGYNSGTVEQIGTDSDCSSGRARYYSWFELYPSPSYYTTISVKPGDVMSAEVSYAGNQFNLNMTDTTTGASFNTTGTVSSAQRSSAEWIVEAPWSGRILPLADFGLAQLGLDFTTIPNTDNATVDGGTSSNIASFGSSVQEITMVNSFGQPKAVPSSLTDGTSFTTQWLRSN